MAWYDTGTVSVTNGSTAVTGSGTNFVAGAQVGEGFYGPDGRLYEIQTIVSATSLTLADAYLGTTQTGQEYKIVPTQSLVADLASQVSTLISDYQSVADNAGEGKFQDGSATSPGITFTLDQDTGFFRDTANEIGVAVAGVKKAEFNSSGLDVTGSVTADGLTVQSGIADIRAGNIGPGSNAAVNIGREDTSITSGNPLGYVQFLGSDNTAGSLTAHAYIGAIASGTHAAGSNPTELVFGTTASSSETIVDRLKIAQNGDISFYEDTGTTPKFFWDASAESLGIGTTSITGGRNLHVFGSGDTQIRVETTTASSDARLELVGDSGGTSQIRFGDEAIVNVGLITYTHSNDSMAFSVNSLERMRIDASGQIGIGTQSPAQPLTIQATTPIIQLVDSNLTTRVANIGGDNGNVTIDIDPAQTAAASFFSVNVDNSEAMRVDQFGNVGIGRSAPQVRLDARDSIVTSTSTVAADSILWVTNESSNANAASRITLRTTQTDAGRERAVLEAGLEGTSGGYLSFYTRPSGAAISEKMRITGAGDVGIGTTSPSAPLDVVGSPGTLAEFRDGVAANFIVETSSAVTTIGNQAGSSQLAFKSSNSEAMRIDASGNLLVGTTSASPHDSSTEEGIALRTDVGGFLAVSRSGSYTAAFNRMTSDGDIVQFRKNGTTVGGIVAYSGSTSVVGNNYGIFFNSNIIAPVNSTGLARVDNVMDIGQSAYRFDDIYATNGTIQTSDRNEKQDIAELDEAERRVAVAAKGLLRKFRWKDAVAEKGDDARIHFGIIAQDLQAAFEAEGLDAGKYAMFIHSTWTDEETGEERSRMGVRYSELLAFIIAAL